MRWRVRPWIRVASVLAWLGLLAQQSSTIHFVRIGKTDASEVALGWTLLAVLAGVVTIVVFRPYIEVQSDAVTLQGPLRRVRLNRADVREVTPTIWGLSFALTDGRRWISIVCQATYSFGEPRWFDVAEAVTGRRPTVGPRDG